MSACCLRRGCNQRPLQINKRFKNQNNCISAPYETETGNQIGLDPSIKTKDKNSICLEQVKKVKILMTWTYTYISTWQYYVTSFTHPLLSNILILWLRLSVSISDIIRCWNHRRWWVLRVITPST